jgi:hypothetical protein
VKIIKIVSLVFAAVIGLWGASVWADDVCADRDLKAAGDIKMKQAE